MAHNSSSYKSDVHATWCPGCGDFAILSALLPVLAEMELPPHRVAIFSGIGCSGRTPHYVNTYGVHTLHGRALPYAIGAKLTNPHIEVIGIAGDGDAFGIGAGHFVNAGRRNVDFTYMTFDNGVYGLTKGQASPTLSLGRKTKAMVYPNINAAINPLGLALMSGYTFVARGYAFDISHLRSLIKRAIYHKGSAFLDVLQPCPTYNDIQTRDWYSGLDRINPETGKPLPRLYKLEETGYDGTVTSPEGDEANRKILEAVKLTYQWGDAIPLGVFYQNEHLPTYEQRIAERNLQYASTPPALAPISDAKGLPLTDIARLFDDFSLTT